MSELTCWACGNPITADDTVCPQCGMDVSSSSMDSGKVDDFLMESDASTSSTNMPEMPSIGDDMALPDLPEDVDVSTDALLADLDKLETKDTPLPDLDSMSLPDIESNLDDMMLPDFDSFEKEEIESEEIEEEALVLPHALMSHSRKSLLWLFGSQYLYWSFYFVLLSFTFYSISDPNYSPLSLSSSQFNWSIIALILGWLGFATMGWFFCYSLLKRKIIPAWRQVPGYLIGFIIWHLILIELVDFLIQPSYLFTGVLSPKNFIMYSDMAGSNFIMLISLFSVGWAVFTLFFGPLFRWVYEFTPRSSYEPQLL